MPAARRLVGGGVPRGTRAHGSGGGAAHRGRDGMRGKRRSAASAPGAEQGRGGGHDGEAGRAEE
eukprot:3689718-Pleurochrysis_carterae.AAC.1